MIGVLIALLVLALFIWLAIFIIDMLPLPEPPKTIAKIIVGLVGLLLVLQQFVPLGKLSLP